MICRWRYQSRQTALCFRKTIQYIVAVRQDSFTAYAISSLNADEENHEEIVAMAEFLCRANYGLRNGNFEMDVRDGEIRYKIFQNCSGGIVPNEEIIRDSIYLSARMFERYPKGIVGIIYGGLSVKEAIDLCEGSGGSPARREATPSHRTSGSAFRDLDDSPAYSDDFQ